MKKNDVLALLGFLMFIFGFTSIMLTVVGVQWSFLVWLDNLPGPVPILLKLLMILGGFILIYAAKVEVKE